MKHGNLDVPRGTTLRKPAKRPGLPFIDETVTLRITGRVNYTAILPTVDDTFDIYVPDETTATWPAGVVDYLVVREDSLGDVYAMIGGRLTIT